MKIFALLLLGTWSVGYRATKMTSFSARLACEERLISILSSRGQKMSSKDQSARTCTRVSCALFGHPW